MTKRQAQATLALMEKQLAVLLDMMQILPASTFTQHVGEGIDALRGAIENHIDRYDLRDVPRETCAGGELWNQ